VVRTRYLVAAGAGLFAAGLGTGLLAKPAKVVTHVQETTKDRIVYQDRVVQKEVAAVQTKEVTRWRTRIVTHPDGTKVETHEAVADKDTASTTSKAAEHDQAAERVTERIVVRDKLVEGARARWLVGAGAGLGLDGHPHYGGLAALRILGPVNLALTVDVPARAALLYAAVQF